MTHVKAGQRRRAKAPKVRTGCRTCNSRHGRIRKVKCDEGQPACKRCTSTGRHCDGYDVQALTKAPQFITTLPGHYQPQEVRAFQFFHERTLAQLAVFIDDDFFNSTVPRIANLERGIWHSVVALSAYHENFLSSIQPRHEDHDKFALRHYNLSIKRILGPNQTATDAHVHIVSCILFICIEVLRGNIGAVIGLLKGGYSVLQEARSSRYKLSSERGASDSIDALYSQAHIFFVRLASQLYTLAGKLDPIISLIADEMIRETSLDRLKHKKLQSLHEAAADLSSIRMEFERFDPRSIPIVSAKLAAWSAALDEYLTTNAEHLTSATSKRTVALLELRKQFFEVDLDAHSSGDDTDLLKWDRHGDKFSDMIKLAEAAMDVSDLPPQLASGPQFHMHTGAVPILYGIACKCRDPAIRRKAASLLTRRPRLEGVWNNATVSRVAFQIMVTEERGLPAQSSMDIPADSRIRGIKVAMGANRQYMLGYMTSQGYVWEHAAKYGVTH